MTSVCHVFALMCLLLCAVNAYSCPHSKMIQQWWLLENILPYSISIFPFKCISFCTGEMYLETSDVWHVHIQCLCFLVLPSFDWHPSLTGVTTALCSKKVNHRALVPDVFISKQDYRKILNNTFPDIAYQEKKILAGHGPLIQVWGHPRRNAGIPRKLHPRRNNCQVDSNENNFMSYYMQHA